MRRAAHNDGTTSTLLDLEGTIPIFYRGNQYNIPVEFWIVENYPMSPPVCFVRPTPGWAAADVPSGMSECGSN